MKEDPKPLPPTSFIRQYIQWSLEQAVGTQNTGKYVLKQVDRELPNKHNSKLLLTSLTNKIIFNFITSNYQNLYSQQIELTMN